MAEKSDKQLDARPWALAITRALSFAEEQNARIVGVTGERAGSGVSMMSRELVHAYVRHGMSAVLIDASRLNLTEAAPEQDHAAQVKLLDIAKWAETNIYEVDLAHHAAQLPTSSEEMARWLKAELVGHQTIIVDLPAIRPDAANQVQALRVVGSACDIVYLVCLSGITTSSELNQAVESCKIHRVPIGGLIVNDWKHPWTSLAAGL